MIFFLIIVIFRHNYLKENKKIWNTYGIKMYTYRYIFEQIAERIPNVTLYLRNVFLLGQNIEYLLSPV